MKPMSPELVALLKTRQFYSVDLYTFFGGNLGTTILRYTSGDQDVVANGFTFLAGGQTGPYFDRTNNKALIHQKIGLDVDTFVFSLMPGSAQIFSVSFQTAVKFGLFDGCQLLLERAYMPTYGDTSCGTLRAFLGRASSIDCGRSVIIFSIAAMTELLNLQLPRNLYQSSCVNNLGDKACGVDLSPSSIYKAPGATVASTSTTAAIIANGISAWSIFPGVFDQGKLIFTSGILTGLQASVKSVVFGSPSTISLLAYTPRPPAIGDSFDIYYGCDKTLGGNGCPKFANTARFRAERLIPQPTTAL